MASSRFTTNLGLCDWDAQDKPKRADFVSDNSIIDSALGGHISNTGIHMSAAEKLKALQPYAVYLYAGSGDGSRTILTEFSPGYAIVLKKNSPLTSYDSGVSVVNSGVAVAGNGGTGGVALSSEGVVVQQQSEASNGVRFSLNESGCQYIIIAFK